MSGGILFLDFEGGRKTVLGIVEAVEFQVDIPEIHLRGYKLWLERYYFAEATDCVVNATFDLVQFGEQIDPAKVLRRKAVGIHVTFSRRCC
jgi:hypothetical protein